MGRAERVIGPSEYFVKATQDQQGTAQAIVPWPKADSLAGQLAVEIHRLDTSEFHEHMFALEVGGVGR